MVRRRAFEHISFGMLSIEPAPRIGRDAEVALARTSLEEGTHVLLRGAGGVGKTHCALHIARAVDPQWWQVFVDLTAAHDEVRLLVTVAEALGVRLRHADPSEQITQIVRAVGRRGAGLVLLDNLEQLGSLVLPLVEAWTAAASAVRLVMTSRHALDSAHVRVIELEGLSSADAADLFRHRAELAGHALREDATAEITGIVRALDGLPVAIEVAVAQLELMTVAEIHAGIASVPRRLESVIERSWVLLSKSQKLALSACAVFVGGFTVRAASALIPHDDPAALLAQLRRHSLLKQRGRLFITESLRQFLLARTDPQRMDALRHRHAAFFLRYADAAPAPTEPVTREAIDAIDEERDNLMAAFAWFASRDPEAAIRIALAVDVALRVRGVPAQQVTLLEAASRLEAGDDNVHTEVQLALARAQRRGGAFDEAARIAEAALDVASGRVVAHLQQLRGRSALVVGDHRVAERWYLRAEETAQDDLVRLRILRDRADLSGESDPALEALRMATRLGDVVEQCFAHWVIGRELRGQRRYAEATTHFGRGLALAKDVGERYLEALIVASHARGLHAAGKVEQARDAYRRAMSLHRRAGNEPMARWAEAELGATLFELDDESGREHIDRALVAAREAGDAWTELLAMAFLAAVSDRSALPALAARAVEHADPSLVALAEAALADSEDALDRAVARGLDGSDRDVGVMVFARLRRQRGLATAPPDLHIDRARGAYRIDGVDVELGAASPLSRILVALVENHQQATGRALSKRELVEAGWPGEKMKASAASNRLKNAVARLRQQGLRDWLMTRSDGYLLRDRCRVRMV